MAHVAERSAAGAGGGRSGLPLVYVRDDDYPWDIRVEKICAALTAAGHDVHIAARNRARLATRERLPEGTVHRMPPWRMLPSGIDATLGFPAFFNPRWAAHLWRVVRRTSARAIIVRDLPLAITALFVARRADIPVVLDMAENYPAMTRDTWDAGRQGIADVLIRNPRLVDAVERWTVPRMDAVLTVVEESAARVIALGAHDRHVHVVSNTPPCAHARVAHPKARGEGSDPLHVVYLGLLEIPRGVAELVDAVRLLRDRGIMVRATIIGDGRDAASFREHAAALRLGPGEVEFTGYVQRDDALRLVAAADIGVVPHHATALWNTTIPNKLFDYMAAGLPVITSDAAPAARIVRAAGAGEVFASRNAAALASAIEALGDPGTRRRRGEAGQRAVLERHNWERDSEELLRAVDGAIARATKAVA